MNGETSLTGPAPIEVAAVDSNSLMPGECSTYETSTTDENPAVTRTETQREIGNILAWMDQLLVHKNKNYGNSALEPLGLFTKFLSENNDPGLNSILVRLDDKLMRVKNAKTLRKNDLMDIMGYLTLLMVSMGVTFEDFKGQMD